MYSTWRESGFLDCAICTSLSILSFITSWEQVYYWSILSIFWAINKIRLSSINLLCSLRVDSWQIRVIWSPKKIRGISVLDKNCMHPGTSKTRKTTCKKVIRSCSEMEMFVKIPDCNHNATNSKTRSSICLISAVLSINWAVRRAYAPNFSPSFLVCN